jgi:hypothetical protein
MLDPSRNYRQTCCQRQFPNWSQIWACRQDVVPSGGIVGGLIGAIEGATGPHIPMHDGAISRALLQRGCIRPLTHWQVHPACTCELNAHKAKAMMTRNLIDTLSFPRRQLILPTTSTNARSLAIRFTQTFYCPPDGRVCSGNGRRLLGNEPVRHGDLRSQNGIRRQVTLVMHCQSPTIAVEPLAPLLQHRPVGAKADWSRLPNKRHGLANSGVPSRKIFFLGRAGIEVLAPY